MYVTKLNFIWRNAKNCPKKMKNMYLCERLNLYQLIMQTAFVTNVSHIKLQNENYIFTCNNLLGSLHFLFQSSCKLLHNKNAIKCSN
jgi:hypothetical protein